jgi:hypothetical protein
MLDASRDYPNRHLSFGNIQVREYGRVINDDPDVSIGLALGWKYYQEEAIPVDHYEKDLTSARKSTSSRVSKMMRSIAGFKRCPQMLIELTTTTQRFKILSEFGYSPKELLDAERQRHQKLKCESSDQPSSIVPFLVLGRRMKIFCRLSRNTCRGAASHINALSKISSQEVLKAHLDIRF